MGMLMFGLRFRRIHHDARCSEVVEHGGSLVSRFMGGPNNGVLPPNTERKTVMDLPFSQQWQAIRSSICSSTHRVGRCSAVPQALVGSRALNSIEDRQQVDRRGKADPIRSGRTMVSAWLGRPRSRRSPWLLRAGPKPCRTTLARPSGSFSSAVVSRNACSSISNARASSSPAPFRRISVSRSSIADG